MLAITLDTETTGTGEFDQPIEVAWIKLGEFPKNLKDLLSPAPETFNQRFNPTVPINAGAFRVHKIGKGMLTNCPRYSLDAINIPDKVCFIIGHNIAFDTRMLGTSDYREICTLKLCRKLYPDIGKYSLSFLIGHFFPDTAAQLTKGAHGALVDTKLCILLLHQILTDFEFDSWESLAEYSENGEKV